MTTTESLMGRTIGDYEIRGELGRGGMGEVYLAHDPSLARDVALKVLRPDLARDATFLQRFQREARAGGQISHPNVVIIFQIGSEGEYHFIAMERVKGRDLAQVLRDGSLDPLQALDIARQTASALHAAHSMGIVHRDVKPHNIMVDPQGRVKVTDFGIAHMNVDASTALTQAGEVLGTILYMSPEQSLGHEITGRSDLYSLGVVLFEMLSGRHPFDAPTPGAIVYKVLQEPPPSILTFNPSLPPELDALLQKVLSKQPDQRFESGLEMEAALSQIMAIMPPSASYTPHTGATPTFTMMSGHTPVRPTPAADPRIEPLLAALRKRVDGEVITEPLVKQVEQAARSIGPAPIESLLQRQDGLERGGMGESDAFARWWVEWSRIHYPAAPAEAREALAAALAFFSGGEGSVDESKALEGFQKAAAMRDPAARMWLARCHYEGRCGLSKDARSAKRLARGVFEELLWLAAEDDREAAFMLGYALEEGLGCTRSEEKAAKWYEAAARGGHSLAMNKLATLYQEGRGVEQNDTLAVSWYRKAAEAGVASAMSNLGWLLKEGRGGPVNDEEAVQWYLKAAEMGHASAMNNLAWMYRHGRGVEKDYEKCLEWYIKAAEQGNAAAMSNLGWMFEHGDGVERDPQQAALWHLRSAEAGNAAAMGMIGSMYRDGRGVEQNDTKALEWFKKGADAGNVQCRHNLARMHDAGRGTPQNSALAFGLYEQCAREGYPNSMFRIARMYEKGKGVERDGERAYEWYRRAADGGEVRGMLQLADMHEQGKGAEKDPAEAARWLEAASGAGSTRAMHHLGYFYENGIGVEKDFGKAAEWYRKSAEAGYALAMNHMGWMHEHGQGVEKSRDQAVEWYQRAAKAGERLAQGNLQRLGAA